MGVSNGTTCPDRAISGARLPRHPSGGGLCNSHRAERQHGCSRSAGLWNAYPLAMRPRGGSGFPRNAQAKTGTVEWLRLIPELQVVSLEASLPFYEDAGFAVAYSRPEEAFVMLVCDGAALMLEEIGGPGRRLGASLLERPLGRGINLQVQVTDVGGLHDRMAEGGWSVSRSWKGDGTAWTTARLAATSSWLSTRTDTYCGSLKTSARGTVSLALELTLLDLALSSNATRWTQVAAFPRSSSLSDTVSDARCSSRASVSSAGSEMARLHTNAVVRPGIARADHPERRFLLRRARYGAAPINQSAIASG